MTKALIIVDVQNDFCEGGSLAVTGGTAVAGKIADHLKNTEYDLIIATRDMHINPGTHWSDNPDYLDTWPVHCKAGTTGAEIKPELAETLNTFPVVFVDKGQYEAAYSGYEGKTADGRSIPDLLKENKVNELDICGIATDYCVKATTLDAIANGIHPTVLTDLVAGVAPATSEEALETMRKEGAQLV